MSKEDFLARDEAIVSRCEIERDIKLEVVHEVQQLLIEALSSLGGEYDRVRDPLDSAEDTKDALIYRISELIAGA